LQAVAGVEIVARDTPEASARSAIDSPRWIRALNTAAANGSVGRDPGTVIRVAAGTTNRHGAKADSWFSHVAFITPGDDVSNEWLEPVTAEEYGRVSETGGTS